MVAWKLLGAIFSVPVNNPKIRNVPFMFLTAVYFKKNIQPFYCE